MKKVLSFIAVTVAAATAVAAGAYIIKKLDEEKDEEVKLIEIINEEPENKDEEETPVDEKKRVEPETPVETKGEEPVKEEPVAEALPEKEEMKETVNEYPSISDRKKAAIRNQIQVMLDSLEGDETVDLQHFLVFPSSELGKAYVDEVGDAYEVETENEGTEVNLSKTSKLDFVELEREILTLAEKAVEYSGAYKGWAVKVEE